MFNANAPYPCPQGCGTLLSGSQANSGCVGCTQLRIDAQRKAEEKRKADAAAAAAAAAQKGTTAPIDIPKK